MKVIVFGATGTVGVYTCLHLHEKGYDVIAVGNRPSDNGFFEDYQIPYYSVNITNSDEFLILPQNNIDCVVNLAGMLPARMKGYKPQQYIDINITGALNIWEYCGRIKASRVVYSQSISDVSYLCGNSNTISADAISKFPLNNDHSVYSITKNAAKDLLIHYSAKYGFNFYILRFPNIYLYHPNPKYYVDGIEKWQGYRLMIAKAMKGEPLSIWGDPGKKRDIVYVKDCCQIIEKCLSVSGAISGCYNVGTGVGVTLEEQVKGIVSVFSPEGVNVETTYDRSKPDAAEYIFDISKNIEILGYKPEYDYLKYLKDFKKEYEMQRFAKLWGYDQTK